MRPVAIAQEDLLRGAASIRPDDLLSLSDDFRRLPEQAPGGASYSGDDVTRAGGATVGHRQFKSGKDMDSSEYTMEKEADDEEVLMEPLFVPIKSEPDFEETLENTSMEENTAITEDIEGMESDKSATKEGDGAEDLKEPLFVPIKVEPDLEGIPEEPVTQENIESTDDSEDMDSSEYTMEKEADDEEVLMEPLFVPIKSEPDFEETLENTSMEENAAITEDIEGMESDKSATKEGDGAEDLKEPLFVPIKVEPDLEGIPEEPVTQENIESTDDSEDMDSSEYTMEKEADDEEVLMEPLFVPIKSEPDFEETLENTSMEENTAITEDIEGMESDKSATKEGDGAEDLKEPLFVPIKVEPDLEGIPEEPVTQENIESTDDSESYQCLKPIPAGSCPAADEELYQDDNLIKEDEVAGEMQEERCDQGEDEATQSVSLQRSGEGNVGKKRKRNFECSTCKKTFARKDLSVEHLQDHSYEGQLKCRECITAFSNTSSIASHVDTRSGVRRYQCPQCGKTFKKRSYLTVHMRIHSGRKPYKCSPCGKSFTQISNLKHHIMQSHGGQRSFKHSQYKIASDDGGTVTVPKEAGEERFRCNECWREFRRSDHLAAHVRIHTGERPFLCCKCGKAFKRSDELTSHMKSHTGEKPYKCNMCEKSFKTSCNLQRHMNSHSEEKSYTCSECGKMFSDRSNCNAHMRTHTRDKPYTCSECGKCFARSYSLTVHMYTHTGERPYCCTQCDKRCTTASNLSAHKRQVHRAAAIAAPTSS